jgi:hypothetical protein
MKLLKRGNRLTTQFNSNLLDSYYREELPFHITPKGNVEAFKYGSEKITETVDGLEVWGSVDWPRDWINKITHLNIII